MGQAVVLDVRKPEPTEKIPSRDLDVELLGLYKRNATGETILDGTAILTRIAELEGAVLNIPHTYIDPNPEQPREYFDPVKLEQLKASIVEEGQSVAVSVVPYVRKDGKVRFFLIDGERRFRVISELKDRPVRAVVEWLPTRKIIFRKSLILNESREEHNPVERAKAYKKLIDFDTADGIKHPIPKIAKELGISAGTIKNHLALLDFAEPIQNLIIRGQLPPSWAMNLAQSKKRLGDKFRDALVARRLIDSLANPGDKEDGDDGKNDKVDGQRRLTLENVSAALEKALIEGGDETEAKKLRAQKVAMAIRGITIRASKAARELVEADRSEILAALRDRTNQPPEVVRDALEDAMIQIRRALVVVNAARGFDPLPVVPGKPTFMEYVRKKGLKSFGNQRIYEIAECLAEASDSDGNEPIPLRDIANILGCEVADVTNNLGHLKRDLAALDLRLQEFEGRIKYTDNIYKKVTLYRLAWKAPSDSKGGEKVHMEKNRQASPAPSAPTDKKRHEKSEPKPKFVHFPTTTSSHIIVPESRPELKTAAENIIKFIFIKTNKKGSSERRVRRVGQYAEGTMILRIRQTVSKKLQFIINSNIIDFSLNFGAYRNIFARIIKKALDTQQDVQVTLIDITANDNLETF